MFKYECNLITIWIDEVTPMLKTDILSIFMMRVIASLAIIAYLSPDNSAGTEEESSSVNNYSTKQIKLIRVNLILYTILNDPYLIHYSLTSIIFY